MLNSTSSYRVAVNSLWSLPGILLSLLVALPMLFVVLSLLGPATGAWPHLQQTVLPDYIGNTLLLMVLVALLASLVAIPTAWLSAATEFPGRGFFSWALLLPLSSPAYIVAYVYTDLLDVSGPVQSGLRAFTGWEPGDYSFPQIRSLPGAALVIALVLYPYVYLLARTAFLQRSSTLFGAARTLGLGPHRAFLRIALPAARPAIIGGLALVLMETLADFGVVEYFGIPTFSTGIFRTWFAMGEHSAALKLAGLMFVFVAVLVMLEKSSRKGRPGSYNRDAFPERMVLRGPNVWLAVVLCSLPVVLGFVVPFGVLIYLALTRGDPLFGGVFLGLTGNSVMAAGLTTLIALALALYFTLLQRYRPSRAGKISVHIATLGYALPGVILAVGLLAPLSRFDRWLASTLEQTFGWNAGLLLTGTITILIYAYVVRFLTLAYNSTHSSLEAVPLIYDHLARSLGASPGKLVRKIHLPLLQRSIFVGGILVFVDTLRELPATLMLRPFNFETLATRVYRLASDERLAEASTAALFIVIIGLIPVLILNRLSVKQS